jgi:O-antigen/teichoic acid export membrane protein
VNAERSLATRAVRGVFWTGSASVIQLVTTMVLYSYLPIGEMGRFEWALILVMFLALSGDLGLSAALVQLRQVGDDHFDAAFWANLVWGVGITVLVLATASLVAPYLGGSDPAAFTRVLRILSLLLPFASVSGVFRARLQRELDFQANALAEIVSTVAYGIFALVLLPWLGILSPIVGSVFREFALLVCLWWSARWRPRCRCPVAPLRQLLPFALNFTGSRAVAYLNTNIASLFIFPLLGEEAQGYYRFAERLTLMPLTRIATTINRVSFPTFASIQDDDALLQRGYLRSVQSLVMLMAPLMMGIFAMAPELLQFLDNTPALVALRFLVVATLLKVMGTMVGSMFMAKGKADWSLYWSLFSLAVLVPSMYFSVPYGVDGITAATAATSLLFLVVSQHLTNRLLGMRAAAYLAALVRPALVTLATYAALAAVRPFLPGSPLAVLVQGSVLGLLVCTLALRLLAWDLCQGYWRSLRGRRAAETA